MFGPKRRNLAPASSFQSDTWGRDQVVSHAGAFGVGPLVGQGMPKRCFRVLSLVLRGPGATFPIFDRGICNRVFPFFGAVEGALACGAAFAAVGPVWGLAGFACLSGGDTDARISSSLALTRMEMKHSSKWRVRDGVTVQ